ncbi:MAG TPA: hypothetical protein VJ399_00145 [Patescibacteria group bacterium]|nr:hypothetical protein [Patescibacteria group bacterium]
MERKEAIGSICDGLSRKFILTDKVLYIQEYPEQDKVSHHVLALNLNLDLSKLKGGNLKAILTNLKFVKPSLTVLSATQKDLDNFLGEIELF